MSKIRFRRMTLADMHDVLTIEKELFTDAWSEADFKYELNHPEFSQCIVLIIDDAIVGYGCLWILYEQGQITTFGIRRADQSKGYGKLLLSYLMTLAEDFKVDSITLEVRISNEAAIYLYESIGFRTLTVRKGYYQDNHEDAYLMLKEF